jgi:CP family cyanate transporter-like MFS transporter
VNNRQVPRPRWLTITALVLVAVNLRIALTSVPAVVVDIKAATGWNDVTLGVLTTIPVLCMGVFALIVPRLAARVGRRRTVALALIALTIALGSRAFEGLPGLLFISAFLAGIGIALGAGLLPGIVREHLPQSVGAATGIWTAAMMLGAAAGAAFTVPLALFFASWGWALAFWALPAALALAVWLVAERHGNEGAPSIVRLRDLPWRHPLAWSLTAYLTLNSIVFYSAIAWLAPSYAERGRDVETSGWIFGLFTVSQVVAALALPHLTERWGGRRSIFVLVALVTTICTLLVGWYPDFLPLVVVTGFGASLGGGFALGLGLLSEYATDAAGAARLTAMAFFVTYTVAAFGPALAGLFMQNVDSWPVVFTAIAAVALAQLLAIPALRTQIRVE